MSSLAKTYALACGVKLSEPEILEQFYPLGWPLDKAVFLHPSASAKDDRNQSVSPGKIYDYYDEVIKLMLPILEKNGYKIFQIGAANDAPVAGTVNLCGQTTIKQTAYLLRRAALLIGNDSMNAHLAGALGTPCVILYGTTDPKNHGPEWKNPSTTILLESHRCGAKRPSYTAIENPKTINFIPPELVVNSAFKLLGLEEISQKSLFIGSAFRSQILEIIPDTMLRPDFFPHVGIAIRMDYLWNEDGLAANLQNRKSTIFADKAFNVDILRACRQNVLFCRIKIDHETDPKFVKEIVRFGAPYSFYTDEKDEKKLKELRYKYLDFCLIDSPKPATIDTFKEQAEKYLNTKLSSDLDISKLNYKSNKYLVSSKGIFLNKAAWEIGRNIPSLNNNYQKIDELVKNESFWKELQHYYIYE